MDVESLFDIAADVADVLARASDVLDEAAPAIESGDWTAPKVGSLRASASSIRADIQRVRVDLDSVDVAGFQRVPNAVGLLELWIWERETRRALVLLGDELRQADEAAETWQQGQRQRVHVVRSGETLQAIAAKYLGDWKEWHRIAAANDLEPGQVPSGTVLVIPETK